MSYDIHLRNEDGSEPEYHGPQVKGGTYCVEAALPHLNVTYNYSKIFHRLWPEQGIRWLYGKRARDTEMELRQKAATLGRDADHDYWNATEGNARLALLDLARLAEELPDAIWEGD